MNFASVEEKLLLKTASLRKRSKEEFILLLMCALSIPSIFPFAIYRLTQHAWLAAMVDFFIMGCVFGVMTYVWRTGRFKLASVLVSVFYSAGLVAAVKVNGISLISWAYPTMISVFFISSPRTAIIINATSLSALMVILMGQVPSLNLLTIMVTIILINLFASIFSLRTAIQHRELNLQAERDFLTDTGNRRALDAYLLRYSKSRNSRNESSMLMIDIDHFKRINDKFGHLVGDDVLSRICSLMRTRTRASDLMFRYGGEEFVVIVESAPIQAAAKLAEELRTLVSESAIIDDYPVTISIGVAPMDRDKAPSDWLAQADRMLYLAKQSGRNLVKVVD